MMTEYFEVFALKMGFSLNRRRLASPKNRFIKNRRNLTPKKPENNLPQKFKIIFFSIIAFVKHIVLVPFKENYKKNLS